MFDIANLRGIPLYSVHDCFRVPACYANQLPNIYVSAFHSLASPFKFLNCFIIHNFFLQSASLNELNELYTWKPTDGIFITYGYSHKSVNSNAERLDI